MARSKEDYPGNTMMSQAAFDRFVYDIGAAVMTLERSLLGLTNEDGRLMAMRLVAPKVDRGEWLIVLSRDTADGRMVSFSSGPDMVGALKTVQARLSNGSLKWKEDQYAR